MPARSPVVEKEEKDLKQSKLGEKKFHSFMLVCLKRCVHRSSLVAARFLGSPLHWLKSPIPRLENVDWQCAPTLRLSHRSRFPPSTVVRGYESSARKCLTYPSVQHFTPTFGLPTTTTAHSHARKTGDCRFGMLFSPANFLLFGFLTYILKYFKILVLGIPSYILLDVCHSQHLDL